MKGHLFLFLSHPSSVAKEACIDHVLTSPPPLLLSPHLSFHATSRRRPITAVASSSHLCNPTKLDRSALKLAEAVSEDELWAAARLRIRTFNDFNPSVVGVEDYKKCLAEREFEALKERIAGKRTGFGRVTCINASLPLSHVLSISDDLCTTCTFSENGEDRVLVGTLDLNQCIHLPDEITGMKPQGIGGDFARAYLSNVCVAKELHRNGLGYMLIAKSKLVAEDWGISDLYAHVAVDNESAKNLYMKSGFVYESDEPAWKARFLDRPRRMLLWIAIPNNLDL
ncbi:hypothetical protein RHSIM_Rhsim01G0012100 [Rhododendron simsii]|uniref:N-acetyltransferase domain-containing protein n=1 Tax=Rhododendron simsii TaxID=118357 RepID=A0A834HHX4_RHOSS|nr:hypothetical protein RHSIM_Rhsim01G0012100 [Rhododendron simsii]